jgi:hypothetical protein
MKMQEQIWREMLKIKEEKEEKFRELLNAFKRIPKPPEEKVIEEIVEKESIIPEEFVLPWDEKVFKKFISTNKIIKIDRFINEELVSTYYPEQINKLKFEPGVYYVCYIEQRKVEKLANLDEFKQWYSKLTQEQKELIEKLWLSTLSPHHQLDRWRVENDFKDLSPELALAKKYNEVYKHYSDKLFPSRWWEWEEGRYSISDSERDYSPYPWGD